jgi:hypothetical protein
MSIILTAATVFPAMTGETIVAILGGGTALGIAGFAVFALLRRRRAEPAMAEDVADLDQARAMRAVWRMPPLDALTPPRLSPSKWVWMGVLRVYLVAAVVLVAVKVVQVAMGY